MIEFKLDQFYIRSTKEQEQIEIFMLNKLYAICSDYMNGKYDVKISEELMEIFFVRLMSEKIEALGACHSDCSGMTKIIDKLEKEQYGVFYSDLYDEIFLYYSIFFSKLDSCHFEQFDHCLLKLDNEIESVINKYGMGNITTFKEKYNISFIDKFKCGAERIYGFLVALSNLNHDICNLFFKYQSVLRDAAKVEYQKAIEQINEIDFDFIK